MLIIAIVGLVALVVVGISYGMYIILNPSRTASDRLTDLAESAPASEVEGFTIGGEAEGIDAVAGTIGKLGAGDAEQQSKLRLQLVQAGFKHKHALEILNGAKVTLALCLPMLVSPIASGLSMTKMAALTLASAAFGYYFPGIYVTNLVNKRQGVLLRSFPDSLDLLVSSVEAGLGVDAAFRRVAKEMEGAGPELAAEFQLVNHEIGAGVSRVDAMKHLYERTGLDEVRSLVNMLSQSERFGTSIAKSLRVHAKATRAKRMAKAEEEAAKVSPKLTVIMILFLLPVLMSVLIGPAAIKVKRLFETQGTP